MNLQIFNKPENDSTYLDLVRHGNKVSVVVRGANGEIKCSLIRFNSDGTFSRTQCVNDQLGFQLTRYGEIKETK